MSDRVHKVCWNASGDEEMTGMHVGIPTGVKIVNEELGIAIIVCAHRSQHKNRELALKLLSQAEDTTKTCNRIAQYERPIEDLAICPKCGARALKQTASLHVMEDKCNACGYNEIFS